MMWALWALVGWCGTPWPHRWWPPPPPPPGPDPWFSKIGGVVGGLAGGFAFDRIWPMGQVTSIGVAATAVGAIVGGVVVSELIGLAGGARKT